jgi:DNA-binding winged helix-turn-helix (wHTH) protein
MDVPDKALPQPGERKKASTQQSQELLHVDAVGHEAAWQGRRLDLSPTEFDALLYLAGRAGQTVSFEQLLQAVWHTSLDQGGSLDQVRSTIKRLRQSLGEEPNHPRYLMSVRGLGYRLELNPSTYSTGRSVPSLLVQVKVLILVGLVLAFAWLLWMRLPGDPCTLVWYRGHQVPIGLLNALGRGSFCGPGPRGINCFDSQEEMDAALAATLPRVTPETQGYPGGNGDARVLPSD